MIVTIFGATGTVGKQLVQQALFKNYTVRAFGRNVFTSGFAENDKLELLQGALFDEEQVYEAIKGSDAVLSVIGGSFDGTDKARSLGMKNIIAQMKKAGVKRIIGLGGQGVLNAPDDTYLVNGANYPPEYRPVGIEHLKAFEYLKESGLDWTFVCSPDIINEGPTGSFITKATYPPEPNKGHVNAGDIALFMLNELDKSEYLQQRAGISN